MLLLRGGVSRPGGPTFTRRGQVFSSLLLCISLGFVGLLSQFFNNETNNIMIIIF